MSHNCSCYTRRHIQLNLAGARPASHHPHCKLGPMSISTLDRLFWVAAGANAASKRPSIGTRPRRRRRPPQGVICAGECASRAASASKLTAFLNRYDRYRLHNVRAAVKHPTPVGDSQMDDFGSNCDFVGIPR